MQTRHILGAAASFVLLAACGSEPASRTLAPNSEFARSLHGDDERNEGRFRFSAWSAPSNLGSPVNTAAAEQAPAISKDCLTLYFHCMDCPGGYGGTDLWVAERASVDAPWGTPQNLGPAINTAANESSPAIGRNGRTLYFDSDRPGGYGGFDIYVTRRHDKHDNLTWEAPVNLGAAVNTTSNEQGSDYLAGDHARHGTAMIYFASNRAGGVGSEDIYSIALYRDGTFGSPTLETGLNSSGRDSGPTVRRDGLEIFFVSDRPGGSGGVDLWTSTRARITDPWSPPVNLGSPINLDKNDAGPVLSFDATTLYFHSPRAENVGSPFFDIWMATREKLHHDD